MSTEVLQQLHELGYTIASLARWQGMNAETLRRHIALRRSGRSGVRVTGRRLTGKDVIVLRERAASGESIAKLAKELGVDRTTVYCAVIGRSWKHLPGAVKPGGHGGKRAGAGRKKGR